MLTKCGPPHSQHFLEETVDNVVLSNQFLKEHLTTFVALSLAPDICWQNTLFVIMGPQVGHVGPQPILTELLA